MNRWNSIALHNELAIYYSQFRGISAPRNSFTEDLWAKILETEQKEATSRGAKSGR